MEGGRGDRQRLAWAYDGNNLVARCWKRRASKLSGTSRTSEVATTLSMRFFFCGSVIKFGGSIRTRPSMGSPATDNECWSAVASAPPLE